jgi:hypothetical protein
LESEPVKSLTDATEDLYRVFARYKLAPRVDGCSHCVSDTDELRLHSAPLRELRCEDLERFAFKAMTTWGSADDFRHFLPRLFELVAQASDCRTDVEVVIGKLNYGEWHHWPTEEQAAVRSFLRAMWLDVLGRFPHPLDADTCLCAIGQAEDDLSWYLAAWKIADSESAACHFAMFIDQNAPGRQITPHHPWKLRNAFWADRSSQARQVMDWALAAERGAELESAFFAFGSRDAETTELRSEGSESVGWIKGANRKP